MNSEHGDRQKIVYPARCPETAEGDAGFLLVLQLIKRMGLNIENHQTRDLST